MNYYSFIPLISFIACLYLAAMVFTKKPEKMLNRMFTLFALTLSMWEFFEFVEKHVTDKASYLFWNNINLVWPLTIVTLFHFILIFTEKRKLYQSRVFLIFIYSQAAVVLVIDFFSIRPSDIAITQWGYRNIYAGMPAVLNMITNIWEGAIGVVIVIFSIHYMLRANEKRLQRQSLLISTGALIFAVTSLSTDCLLPKIFSGFTFYVPSFSHSSLVISALFIGYAIWKYQLFVVAPENAADEIIETMSDIFILLNPEGRITRVNQAAQTLLGYSDRELYDMPLDRIVPVETEFIMRGRGLNDREVLLFTAKEEKIRVSLSASILYDKNENVQGYVVICRNQKENKDFRQEAAKLREVSEDPVMEQTTDLIRINMSLKKEIESKERYEEELYLKNQELTSANEDLKTALKEHEATSEKYEIQNEKLIQSTSELQKNEAFQRSLLKVVPTGIGVVVNREFSLINKQILDMTGYSADEIYGKKTRIFYPTDEEFDFVGREMSKQITKFGTGTVETQWLRKDGEVIDILLSATHIDSDDLSAGIAFTAFDITDRKIIEKKLRESEEHLRKLLENSPVGIGISDEEGNYTFLNRKFSEIFGYTIDDIPDLKTWWEKAYPDENYRKIVKETWSTAVERSRETGNSIEPQEWEVTCKNGNMKHIQFTMTQIGDLTIIVINNLTEKKQAEKLLVQTEKMMTVGRLAAGMAHEINNPLGIILQGIQITLNRLSPENRENREIAEKSGTDLEMIRKYLEERNIFKYLESIRDAGMRASYIITNMLRFSRGSGPKKKPEDLRVIIEKAIEIASKDYNLEKKYDFRSITINRNFEITLGNVPCVETEIQQVMLNLLNNSSQAMAEISDKNFRPVIDIKTFSEDGYAVVEIKDNGPGMEREVLKRIFEPFYTTKKVGTGTGLGLSVSYFIITNNHGGIFTVESEPGAGATFIIKLPVH